VSGLGSAGVDQLGEIVLGDYRIVGRFLGTPDPDGQEEYSTLRGYMFTVQRYDREGTGGWEDVPMPTEIGPAILVPMGKGRGRTLDRLGTVASAVLDIAMRDGPRDPLAQVEAQRNALAAALVLEVGRDGLAPALGAVGCTLEGVGISFTTPQPESE
jgi:hypothetical protein